MLNIKTSVEITGAEKGHTKHPENQKNKPMKYKFGFPETIKFFA